MEYKEYLLVATCDEDILPVMDALPFSEKINRMKTLYPDADYVADVLGFTDGSVTDKFSDVYNLLYGLGLHNACDEVAYQVAINNGNFEEAIAYNKRLPN